MAEYASGVNPADFVSAMQQLGGRVQQQVVAAEVLTVTGSTVEIQERPTELEPTLPGLEDERLVAAEARVRELESQAIQLGTALHFEQLNRIIYRSQWNALVMLSIRGDAGAAEPELQTFLEEHQRAAPLLGQVPNGTIGELLAWPMANSLLTRGNDGKYFITDWGKRFVHYRLGKEICGFCSDSARAKARISVLVGLLGRGARQGRRTTRSPSQASRPDPG